MYQPINAWLEIGLVFPNRQTFYLILTFLKKFSVKLHHIGELGVPMKKKYMPCKIGLM